MREPMLRLPDIELVAIRGGGEPSRYFLKALRICMGLAEFGKVTFFTNEEVPPEEGIDIVRIPEMDRMGYSAFCIWELHERTTLPFVLIVQSDGFITNPSLWVDKFLQYDYVGAPWAAEEKCEEDRVGNGGFSLRSRKFLEVCERFPFPISGNEDYLLCRQYRVWMKEQGIKFAPIHIAAQFSREQYLSEFNNNPRRCFGFHGWTADRGALWQLIYGCSQ
jgi:hypothetical protein